MSDDQKPEAPKGEPRPDPLEDARKGLGLLFRAAKSAIQSLPTHDVEEAVMSGAREVGRAIENVTQTLDKQLFKRDRPAESSHPSTPSPSEKADPSTDGPDGKAGATHASTPPSDPPKGPRVE